MERESPTRYPVTIEADGQTFKGTYWVSGKIMTVTNGRGSNSTQVGSLPVQELAEQMLSDIVKAGMV